MAAFSVFSLAFRNAVLYNDRGLTIEYLENHYFY